MPLLAAHLVLAAALVAPKPAQASVGADGKVSTEELSVQQKKDQEDMLKYVPKEEMGEVKDVLSGKKEFGSDLSPGEEDYMKKIFSPDMSLTHLISMADPACLPVECKTAFKACRVNQPDCEKRIECMQRDTPGVCWDVKLGEMSSEEGALLMCGQQRGCVQFGLNNLPSMKDGPGMSLLQTASGFQLAPTRAVEMAKIDARFAQAGPKDPADFSQTMDAIDASFAEVSSKMGALREPGDVGDTELDLQRDLANIANGAKAEDFDAMMDRLGETQQRMKESNQKLESIGLKLKGEEKRISEKADKSKFGMAPPLLPTSLLENGDTPTLARLHQELGDFLASVTKDVHATEQDAASTDKDVKQKLADAEKKFELESKLLSPETRRALEIAGSFAELQDAPSSFVEAGADAEDGDAIQAFDPRTKQIAPEALLAISQLQDVEMPASEKFLHIMKGFQEADGASHPQEEMTQMLDGVRLFLQDSKEHGITNVFQKMLHDHMTTAGVDEHGEPKGLSSLAEGKIPFAGTSAEAMAAAVASMAGLGMGGFNPATTLEAINSGPMSKYLKELGMDEHGPLLKAGLAYLDNNNATEGEAVENAMPATPKLVSAALEMLQDPAALGQLHQMGLDVPALDPDMAASLKTAMAKMSPEQLENMRKEAFPH